MPTEISHVDLERADSVDGNMAQLKSIDKVAKQRSERMWAIAHQGGRVGTDKKESNTKQKVERIRQVEWVEYAVNCKLTDSIIVSQYQTSAAVCRVHRAVGRLAAPHVGTGTWFLDKVLICQIIPVTIHISRQLRD